MVDDGYLIGYEDGSGNFVEVGRFNNQAEDTNQPIEIVHSGSGEKVELGPSGFNVPGTATFGSVNTDDMMVGSSPAAKGISQGNSVSYHRGDRVSVAADSWSTIFDLSSVVDVIQGSIIGESVAALRVTWSDDTTDAFGGAIRGNEFVRGQDSTGDNISVVPIPQFDQVKKLEFFNDQPSGRTFGYAVWTV